MHFVCQRSLSIIMKALENLDCRMPHQTVCVCVYTVYVFCVVIHTVCCIEYCMFFWYVCELDCIFCIYSVMNRKIDENWYENELNYGAGELLLLFHKQNMKMTKKKKMGNKFADKQKIYYLFALPFSVTLCPSTDFHFTCVYTHLFVC